MKLQSPDDIYKNCGFTSLSHPNQVRYLGTVSKIYKGAFFENS